MRKFHGYMKFGILVPNHNPLSTYENISTKAENLGFDGIFLTDHFSGHNIHSRKPGYRLDAWSVLAFLAGKTDTIRLGTCVSPVTLRYPPQLAKVVATVDHLSNGRTILGAGAGDDKIDFLGYGVVPWGSPAERVGRFKEAIQLIKSLWIEDSVDFHGKYYELENVVCEPKPIQKPHSPIWVGAIHSRMVTVASEIADTWVPSAGLGITLSAYENSMLSLKQKTTRLGRNVGFAVSGIISDKQEATRPLLATFDSLSTTLEKYAQLGCEYVIANFDQERFPELMTRFWNDFAKSF